MINFTLPSEPVDTVAYGNHNQITKEFYDHLVGEINRGTVRKAVCRVHYPKFNYTTYNLISI